MTITRVLILAGISILLGFLRRGRSLVLMGFSILLIFWLQPANSGLSHLSFWLPVLTIIISVFTWIFTTTPDFRGLRENWPALAVLAGAIVAALISGGIPWLDFPEPGSLKLVFIALLIFMGFAVGLTYIKNDSRFFLVITAVGLIAIFVIIKFPILNEQFSLLLSRISGQPIQAGMAPGITWLGYSYVAFRLLHTIRDRRAGVLPAVGLAEYINYIIFFPSFTAGPIDRLERFVGDLRSPLPVGNEGRLFAIQRLAFGLFKKFFIADMLALVSISDVSVEQALNGGWLWLMLCAYSFRVYFDFSGYTDIAIGLGRLLGFRLPENFAAPFLKSNLTQFWNSWHITLTGWFRSYFFYPFTRFLRSSKYAPPPGLIIFLGQIGTMLLIGLWHGITWNFALWGIWHGIGLFVQNRWSELVRTRFPDLGKTPGARRVLQIGGILLTFCFFTLGIAFFALSSPQLSFEALRKILGMA